MKEKEEKERPSFEVVSERRLRFFTEARVEAVIWVKLCRRTSKGTSSEYVVVARGHERRDGSARIRSMVTLPKDREVVEDVIEMLRDVVA